MNVISASRRTDIPAWYGEWFGNRLRAGYAVYRNPFGGQHHTVSLDPADVIAFVFWTRNALPFLPVIEKHVVGRYASVFLYTANGYGPPLEPTVHDTADVLDGFARVSGLLGDHAVHWRYDPIVLGLEMNRDFHLRNFEFLAGQLEGRTTVCHTSFVQFYRKTKRRLDRLDSFGQGAYDDPPEEEKIAIARELKDVAASRGIELVSCCTPLLDGAGLGRGRCVDPALISRLRPDLPGLTLEARPTRDGCGCAASRDIGAYNTCQAGCVYCYATDESERTRRALQEHDPKGECL